MSALASGQDAPITLEAGSSERGFIRLTLHSPPGTPVVIDEVGGPRVTRLTPHAATTILRRAADWRCDEARVRTPSCAHRLALVAPARAHTGREVRMRLVDRWGVGNFAARVCIEPPGGPPHCRRVRLRQGQRSRHSSFHVPRPGGWRVTARTGWGEAGRGVRVAPPGGSLKVLATGDSMVQRLDASLARRLRPLGVRVRSDAHPATGISKPSPVDWLETARRQAGSLPDVVVMFIGAGDTFPLSGASCCREPWVAEYARRARSMMGAYARGGRARVYWLLLPTPREGFVRRSFPAINRALRRAAASARRDVRIVDLVDVFSPGGRYRKWIRRGDREVGVRQADGIHLSDEGAAIAAGVVVRILREERILP